MEADRPSNNSQQGQMQKLTLLAQHIQIPKEKLLIPTTETTMRDSAINNPSIDYAPQLQLTTVRQLRKLTNLIK
jgi:hypothetical protein